MVNVLYRIVCRGAPTPDQLTELTGKLAEHLRQFGLAIGGEVEIIYPSSQYTHDPRVATTMVYFGAVGAAEQDVNNVLDLGVPCLPVVSLLRVATHELPEVLQPLNAVGFDEPEQGMGRVVTALLEAVGLMSRQRRVFLSYRRTESRAAALQLFDALSSRVFDVFLDTHEIAPGEDFQAVLWHNLCDSDVLVVLDTPDYFDSRWTSAEFGRALAKQIPIYRIGWPDHTPSRQHAAHSVRTLTSDDFESDGQQLNAGCLDELCQDIEALRSKSHAVRGLNFYSKIREGVEMIGGQVLGKGSGHSILLELADGRKCVLHPTIRVPTSMHLHEVMKQSPDEAVVVYDEVGLHEHSKGHIDWLQKMIAPVRYIKLHETAWQLADYHEGDR
ncbi:hypothetical protein MACH10_29910 [Thalassospira tepidiphila]|uniref:toll/interleukin-1 receptor domain-containing protein n=1 Tax=Thalassospira tepidiphila TaxID=393657 RepID=UPI00292133D3|nr:hypothetical protein MACH10_29910 [Thalassospira tepidiphila]